MPQEFRPDLTKGFSLKEISNLPYYVENFRIDENGRLVAVKNDKAEHTIFHYTYNYGAFGVINLFYGYDSSSPSGRKIVVDAEASKLKIEYDAEGNPKYVWEDDTYTTGQRVFYKITELKENYAVFNESEVIEENIDVKIDDFVEYRSADLATPDLHWLIESDNEPLLYDDILVEISGDYQYVYLYDISTNTKTPIYWTSAENRVLIYRNDSINPDLILNENYNQPNSKKYHAVIFDCWLVEYNSQESRTYFYFTVSALKDDLSGTDEYTVDFFIENEWFTISDIADVIGFSVIKDEVGGEGFRFVFVIRQEVGSSLINRYFECVYYNGNITVSEINLETFFPPEQYSYKIASVVNSEYRDRKIISGFAYDKTDEKVYFFVYLSESNESGGTSEMIRMVQYNIDNNPYYLDPLNGFAVSPLYIDWNVVEFLVYYKLWSPPEMSYGRFTSFLAVVYEVNLYQFFNQNYQDNEIIERHPNDSDYWYALASRDISKYDVALGGFVYVDDEGNIHCIDSVLGRQFRFTEYRKDRKIEILFKFFDYYIAKDSILRKIGDEFYIVADAVFVFNNPKVLFMSGKYYVIDGDKTWVFTPHYFYRLDSRPYFNSSGDLEIYTRLRVKATFSDGYEGVEILPYWRQFVNDTDDPSTTHRDTHIRFYFIDQPQTLTAEGDIMMYVTDEDPATPDYYGRFVHPETGAGAVKYKYDAETHALVFDDAVALSFNGVKNYCTDQVDSYGVLPPIDYKQINEKSTFWQNRILVPIKNKIYYSDIVNPHCFHDTYLYLGFNEDSDIISIYGKANTLLVGFENGSVYIARGILPDWYVDSDGLVRLPNFQIKKLPFHFKDLRKVLIHGDMYYAICKESIYVFDDDNYKKLYDLTPPLPIELDETGNWAFSIEPLDYEIFEVSEEHENAVYIPVVRKINDDTKIAFLRFTPFNNTLFALTTDVNYDATKKYIFYYAPDNYNGYVIANDGETIYMVGNGNGLKDNLITIYMPALYTTALRRVMIDGKARYLHSDFDIPLTKVIMMASDNPNVIKVSYEYEYPQVGENGFVKDATEVYRKILKPNLKGKYIGLTFKNYEYINDIVFTIDGVAKRNELEGG